MRHVARRRSRPPVLVLVTVLLVAVVTGVAAIVASGLAEPDARYAARPAADVAVDTTAAAEELSSATTPEEVLMLRAFDRARSEAWAEADVTALDALYAPGSAAGRRDVAALAAYVDRGLRVEGLRTQVLSAELRRSTDRRRVMWVTDRIVGGEVVGESGRTGPLPSDHATRRELVWRLVDGDWLLDRVREV